MIREIPPPAGCAGVRCSKCVQAIDRFPEELWKELRKMKPITGTPRTRRTCS